MVYNNILININKYILFFIIHKSTNNFYLNYQFTTKLQLKIYSTIKSHYYIVCYCYKNFRLAQKANYCKIIYYSKMLCFNSTVASQFKKNGMKFKGNSYSTGVIQISTMTY